MYRVIVFAGTTEGNEICEFLAQNKIRVLACVATEYGSRSLEEGEFLNISAKRMTMEEMTELFLQEQPELVLDATHPYAAEVTMNIRQACEAYGKPVYQRVLREQGDHQQSAVYVESTEDAVEYLKQTSGNVLLTTGSKELAKYTALPGYQERLYARVLSLPAVMCACSELGFEGKNLIGMQGPFTKELNAAMLRQYDCRYLVTKDTGKAGGFQEKMEAALECGVIPVIIGRPLKEEGVSVEECKTILQEQFRIDKVSNWKETKITLAGIGMGSYKTATAETMEAVKEADLLIGAKRMLEAVSGWMADEKETGSKISGKADTLEEYRSEVIAEYLHDHPGYKNVVILLSGDVGFYSGAKKLLEVLGSKVNVICGISSAVYFMAKIGLSWDDAKIVSNHGRNSNLISWIRQYEKVFSILGSGDSVSRLAAKLDEFGMGEVLLYVGENLSYEDEKIVVKKAKELRDYTAGSLCVVCACNKDAVLLPATHGKKDEEFLRGSAPMTKEEVRTVSLAKLRLRQDSVCYDVGAGTGSVAVEMALRAHQGRVYAIEKKEAAADLIVENRKKFALDHLEVIRGEAPEALVQLPVPTHAFIGGSSGNLRQIMEVLVQKNPQVRMVINCITLETVSEALECIRTFGFRETEMVQVGIARAKELGRYHMMMGENPIYVITCQGIENSEEQ